MGGFSAEWLSLREPCDTRARSEEFVFDLRSRLPSRPLQVIDLGSGTGSNIRFMAPRLGGEQHWTAVDNDSSLMEGRDFRCNVTHRHVDLATDLKALPLAACDLVTASALLDLVSAAWLELLASACAEARAAVLFALSYDGRVGLEPSEPDDEWLIDLINRHQHGDKGFGPALGPEATRQACDAFAAVGYQWRITASDWVIEPAEQALQRELIAGWIGAALELAPSERDRIERWGRRRNALVSAGTSRIRVGHQDFVAWPTAPGE
jgi:SAM-dependent methyltransferase